MENIASKIKCSIHNKDEDKMIELLSSGLDPNFEGGWPIRLAARKGCYSIVKTLLHFGANPHSVSESGASTLQLAVYSEEEWLHGQWDFLLSCCDSSQLADGAAVAIIFQNTAALEKILATGRCNTNIATTLTGKTVEQLAKGYKLEIQQNATLENQRHVTPINSPRNLGQRRTGTRNCLLPSPRQQQTHRNLSPSVARFFDQTATQTVLTSPRNTLIAYSPTGERVFTE